MRPARRTVLAALGAGAGAVLTAAVPVSAAAPAAAPAPGGAVRRGRARGGVGRVLAGLEREHGARLGVWAWDTGSGRVVAHRADELFPMCSVFKTLASAAVLRDLDRDGAFLARRIRYTQADVDRSGHSPWTKDHVADGLTVGELCRVAITHSDNTAANLVLRELGGPTAVTRFARSLGDRVTRLDRWEPELNSAEPDRVTDTTSPRAIGRTYARLVLGDGLGRGDRELLTGWLRANTTSSARFRKGLPPEWVLGDKTGGGWYGTNNDVGIAWPPHRAPLVLAVLTTKPDRAAAADDALVARTAEVLAGVL
ncbi:class A beta-lactamase [Streptomyces bambusae]|uniref:class A beta-lactamase n=1 Tax=Streptomyces bambusae TaxID=1550616 RepID=UPI001CFEEFB6|nr:class A beta-lactamase [Streptomyces bambusae]MCB5167712.1 class A beta-lactamase [Streptomyces bambusae]